MSGRGCFSFITEDCLNSFFGRVQFLFNFATEKFVVIKDWRLGLILRLLQVGILIYVLYDVISKASYLLQEVPKGVISPGADVTGNQRRSSFRNQRRSFESGDLSYCENSTAYNYQWNDVEYNDFKCIVMDSLMVPVQGESKFLVTTYLRLDKMYFVSVPSGYDCRGGNPPLDISQSADFLGNFYGICLYNNVEQYFPISPEEIKLEFLHSYYTSVVDKSGTAPETIISAPGYGDGGELKVEKGSNINLTMKRLLEIAGVDLDKPLDEQPNRKPVEEASRSNATEFEDRFPMARVSGVNIIMNFKYYMRSLAPGDHRRSSGGNADNVVCLVELEPQYIWSVQGSDIQHTINDINGPFFVDPEEDHTSDEPFLEGTQVDYQRNGIRLTFQVSGNVGVFDFFSLVDALVSGAVLLSIAQLIVTYVALYALGLSSLLYAEFMRESVNWRKEYARFAAQSLVAGSAFKDYDKNESWTLDRREIYEYLSEVIRDALNKDKIALLTDFLMRQGEHDADVSKGRLDEEADIKISTINISEWIDIFTEEKVKLSSLDRLIDQEYNDPKIRELLIRLAEGRHVRGLTTLKSGDAVVFEREEDQATSERLLEETGVSKKHDKDTGETSEAKRGDDGNI